MSTPTPVLEFPLNDADESEGLGDAGIETFRDAPYASCAREAGQNSRDAQVVPDKPVRVSFEVLHIAPDEIPGYGRLVSAFQSCLSNARDSKEIDFFSNALKVAGKPSIPVLRIADYNTTGLVGPPNQANTPFNSLLKSKGISKKESDTSGGSFGIGKNASMAVSELQTVFYSTCYLDPLTGEKAFAAQGKAILVSHVGEDGEPRRATGYWGNPEKFQAVTSDQNLPDWLRRREVGASIFCMGFRESEYWIERMVCSLVSNFFIAVHRDQMEFEVQSQQINRNTLGELLGSDQLSKAVETTAHKADLEFAKDLYRCLTSGLAQEETISIPGLGDMRVRILVETGMPSRIGFARNGMLITDNLSHFGQPLARFNGAKDFICLVEPVGDESARLLKQMENPAHNAFSAERLSDPIKRESAKKAMSALGKRLRGMIRDQAGIQPVESQQIDELAFLFGEIGTSPALSNEADPEKYTYTVVRLDPKKNSQSSGVAGNNGGSARNRHNKKATNLGPAWNNTGGGGQGAKGREGRRRAIPLSQIRNRITDAEKTSRSVFFTPCDSGQVELVIQATGVNTPEQLVVSRADIGSVSNGSVLLSVTNGERLQLNVEFDEPYDGPIEISALRTAEVGG